MQGEITRKSVLLECLSIMREELRICSKGYNCLEPAKGMEEAWEQGRRKVQILQHMIQAYESEPVRRSIAEWQKDVMENGPSALWLETDEPDTLALHKKQFDCPHCGGRIVTYMENTNREPNYYEERH